MLRLSMGTTAFLVRAGLRLLASSRGRAGVQALRNVAGIKPERAIGAMEIAFRLAPRLNAPGRLADPSIVVQLLRERDPSRARALATQIEELNSKRKKVQRQTTEEAIHEVLQMYGPQPPHGIVVGAEGWHRGVVGISAARLVDRFDVPAIVIAFDEDGIGHGSARTPEGINVYQAIAENSSGLKRFGGHEAAAGLTLSHDQLDTFRAGFAKSTPAPEANSRLPTVDVELKASSPLPSVRDLMRLEPLGEANAQPILHSLMFWWKTYPFFPTDNTSNFVCDTESRFLVRLGQIWQNARMNSEIGLPQLGSYVPTFGVVVSTWNSVCMR